ncbi:MAG TPA: hypothetical protein VJT73_02190, partial [Polyangiaceae bacterium]|nr:hypothetical protein [Polyangiaceae bacterium]
MIDVASIVPSSRDFLQAIATRKKRLALVALVDRSDDAARLAAAGITAFAVRAPGDAMRAVSAAVGSCPVFSLAMVTSADDALRARASGADAVVIDALDPPAWDALSKHVRSTRMASLSLAFDDASAALAVATVAKAAYLRADGGDVPALASKLGSFRTLAHVPAADE